MLKSLKLEEIIYQKSLLWHHHQWKNFYDQAVDSDLKRYEVIRKITTGQGVDYTTGCVLDFGYITNHYRLIAVDLSRQKELDLDSRAIQQI